MLGIELTPQFWVGLTEIVLVNIVLSGDNALVIALACRNLPKQYQRTAILAGSAGAILLRVVFVLIVDQLMQISFLKLAGGLLLLWIGVKLVQGEDHEGDKIEGSGSIWGAIRTIVIADAVMSLDNAIAIAAAAKGNTALIIIGLLVSIPLIVFGATLIMMLLGRFPIIVVAGGALLGWIAGEVIATDPGYSTWLQVQLPSAKLAFEIGCAVFCVALGLWLQRRAKAAHAAKVAVAGPIDLAKGQSKE
ncbi:MAG: TerC family protein [Alphaproteobacteria bacterium]|nr:TerC family protein [Alphaproteobacteria bacterium]